MRSIRTKIAAVIAVIAMAVAGVVAYDVVSVPKLDKARLVLESAGDRCFKIGPLENGGAVVDCLDPAVGDVTRMLGVKASMGLLVSLATEQKRWEFCHRLSHEVAHAGVTAGEPYDVLASVVSVDCNMGYMDGLVMAIAEQHPTDRAAARAVLEFCRYLDGNAAGVDECGHGFGHVLWERHHGDVNGSMKACRASLGALAGNDVISGASASAQCIGGVGMSVVEEGVGRPELLPSGRALGVCAGLGTEETGDCVSFASPFDAAANGATSSLEWCSTFASGQMDRCAGGIGYWAANSNKDISVLDVCDRFGVKPDCLSAWEHRKTTTG